ncbi:hypothetical protein CROQUDRAFT_532265 [Cronartium quercuum f. sp. fusiforme G11]|uniref:Uncharacterized protein n=1 Tax=Cronartium quercuum f. sp. fusiforme G11 TaxID=708437 RepID=A0A9P6NFU4_9BASI|nr:hypothetical protein CROQUDRAFT_532265 [Cronartium quercuum f. sp. fusiforme G11]
MSTKFTIRISNILKSIKLLIQQIVSLKVYFISTFSNFLYIYIYSFKRKSSILHYVTIVKITRQVC